MNFDELGARIIVTFGDGKVFLTESFLFGVIVAVVIAVFGRWFRRKSKTGPKGKQIFSDLIVGWL